MNCCDRTDSSSSAGLRSFIERRWLVITVSIVFLVFCLNCYRAVTQSIVHDEALTWIWFVQRPMLVNLGPEAWNVNNHLLNTLLCDVTTRLLPLSAVTLRLPSLCLGILFLGSALVLCRRQFGATLLGLLAFLALALNPLILDFLVLARGYGMSLGFLVLGLVLIEMHLWG